MDKYIIELIKKLKSRNRNDLANLLVGCKSGIEETNQYGPYLNKLSSFVIYAPKENYGKLQKISKNDTDTIFQFVLEFYPKSEDLEIGFLNFRPLPNEKDQYENQELANSWLRRARIKLDEGSSLVFKCNYAEAVSSFQECIELSLKAISLLLLDKYQKEHKFDEKEFKEVLSNIPNSLKNLEFHKLYLYSKFWGNFYTVAKYGLEELGIGAEKLLGKDEAELAQKHADRCYFKANQLKIYLEDPW